MKKRTDKVIGTITTYHGGEFGFLKDHKVKVIAVMKDCDDEESDDSYITDDDHLRRAGGISANDRVEVTPWIESKGRFSFATSDPMATDLACFAELTEEQK